VIGLLLVAALGSIANPPPGERAEVAGFALKALDGARVSLDASRGEVVVVVFWATWCKPCKRLISWLGERPDGLRVLAVAMDEPRTAARIRGLVRRSGWRMPVLHDRDGAVAARLNPRGLAPFTLLIDRQGRLAHAREGFAAGDEAELGARLDALLAESR
jgi:cytochrome c biogenesis protein CcmG, thiol:disulfide interchange protein DsbE